MTIDADTLEIYRTRPQRTKLDLFIFEPTPVLKCQINDIAITKGARTIKFNNITLGSYADVLPDMTVLVGLTEGGEEVGRVRLRSCIVDQMVVGENSNIKWENGLHLTVLKFWEVWPIYPRIIQNPNNDTDVIFYKDYDIPHTNQNNALGTFLHAGVHQGVLLVNGTGSVYYDASGSFNLAGSDISYQWAFESGTPATSVAETPGWVNYHTTGDYITRLTATSANGSVDTSYRYISVRDKMGEGSRPPIVRWTMGELSESVAEGGGSVEITVFDQTNITESSVIILMSDDWYGNQHVSLGGNTPNSEKVFFVGFVDRGSIKLSAFDSSVSFTASSITAIMKRSTGFSVSVESKPSATKWFELLDMDVRRAVYHYLRWHSTVLSLADFNFRGDDRKIQYFDADRGSLFDAVDNLMRGTLYGTFTADRQGNLWAEVQPQAYDDPTGTFIPEMEFTRRDWKDRPSVEDRYYDEASYLELGGVAYSGAFTGTFSAYLADAPGGAPSRMGGVETSSGLALLSQAQLNSLVGHVWANKNCDFPTIEIAGAVAHRNLDISPYKVIYVNLQPEDTILGKRITGIYFPSAITWKYDPKLESLLPNFTLTRLVNGNPGDSVKIHSEVPDDGFDFPDWDFPPFPTLIPPEVLALYDPTNIANVLVAIKDHGIFYTRDFNTPYPTWYPMNIGLPGLTPAQIEVSATGKVYFQWGLDSIWVAPYFGATWGKLFDINDIGNPGGYPYPRGQAVSGFGIDRKADDLLVIFGSLTVTIFGTTCLHMWVGNSSKVALVPGTAPSIHFEMSGALRTLFASRVGGGWLITFYGGNLHGKSQLITDDGGYTNNWDGVDGNTVIHTKSTHAPSTVFNLYHQYMTTDSGASWREISGTANRFGQVDPDQFQSIITNADGSQIVIGTYNVAIPPGLVYSLDGGANWVTGVVDPNAIPGDTVGVTSVWHLENSAYVVTSYNNNVEGSTRIWANYDLASGTFIDKTGNLGDYITGTFYPMAIRHYYTND